MALATAMISSHSTKFDIFRSHRFVNHEKYSSTGSFRLSSVGTENKSLPRLKVSRIGSQSDENSFMPTQMTYETALRVLNVQDGASFDQILSAKRKMMESNAENQEFLLQIEIAYDFLLMESLKVRRSGKVSNPNVKFADVTPPQAQASKFASKVLKSLPVEIESPNSEDLTKQSAVYLALIVWTFIGGLSQGDPLSGSLTGPVSSDSVPGLQLALAFGASLYFLREKRVGLGKAALITAAGLIAGALIGNGVESWLRVDIFPVFGISSPVVVVSEGAFVALWLVSAFLR